MTGIGTDELIADLTEYIKYFSFGGFRKSKSRELHERSLRVLTDMQKENKINSSAVKALSRNDY